MLILPYFFCSEIEFRRTLAEKRRREAEENGLRLAEARESFQRSRERLRVLIGEKEERSKNCLLEKQRYVRERIERSTLLPTSGAKEANLSVSPVCCNCSDVREPKIFMNEEKL